MKAKLIKEANFYGLKGGDKIIGTSDCDINSLLNYPFKLSLKNCQAIELGYDLENMADFYGAKAKGSVDFKLGANQGFEEGFQKALEILGDKKFSEEDLKRVFIEGSNWTKDESLEEDTTFGQAMSKSIQSLQQTEWDVEIEMEWNPKSTRCDECGEGGSYMSTPCDHANYCKHWTPKLDADGCLILKRKI